jgi:hypothetical protein
MVIPIPETRSQQIQRLGFVLPVRLSDDPGSHSIERHNQLKIIPEPMDRLTL